LDKPLVPFVNISVDRSLGMLDALVIAIVDDGASHPAEYRLNHIQKLSP
jgi:hypothetical protein